MSGWRWCILFAVAALACAGLSAQAFFIADHGRLPHGGGEVLNWLLGLR